MQRQPRRFRPILMASVALLVLLSIVSFPSPATLNPTSAGERRAHRPGASLRTPAGDDSQISQACRATRFQQSCVAALTGSDLSGDPKAIDIILTAMHISLQNLNASESMVKAIHDAAGTNLNMTTAARNCLEVLSYSRYRISVSAAAPTLQRRRKDARAWMSAALVYQYDCWSALKYVNTTQQVNQTMAFIDNLTHVTSNALSMLMAYDVSGEDVSHWSPPRTERDGFWEEPAGAGAGAATAPGFPAGDNPDATVCKNGESCYRTVQEAVNAAPDLLEDGRRFVIRIKEGVYEEIVRIPLQKKNVVFIGDGMGRTVITGNQSVQIIGLSTYNTATVGVAGDGFMARDLTFQNMAGPESHQAVAFCSSSDLSWVQNCEFVGHQDTLYAHSLRQLYSGCRISGTVDFIFGNSAAVFHDCVIQVRPRELRPEKGESNTITAHGRTDPAQSTGFVFQSCTITGSEDYMRLFHSNPSRHKNYLGRPWKEYSRTVFIGSQIGEIIRQEGWLPWSGDFALSTLYYGEYGNRGPGSNLSRRVPWSSQIPPERVMVYSVQNFIQGNEWLQSGMRSELPL